MNQSCISDNGFLKSVTAKWQSFITALCKCAKDTQGILEDLMNFAAQVERAPESLKRERINKEMNHLEQVGMGQTH